MTRHATKVGRTFSGSLAAWFAAISLLNFAPGLIYAQIAKPPPAGKASTPWKFRLEEARIEDIHRAIKSRQITCERWCKPTSIESAPTTTCASRP